MWRIARRMIASSVVAVVAVGVGASSPVVAGPTQPTDPETASVDEFFVVQADGGTISGRGDDLSLTVRDVESDVEVISRRPENVSGSVPVKQLLRLWQERDLDEDPPNAVLTVFDGKGAGTSAAFELSDPSYQDGELTFDAEKVESLDDEPVAIELQGQTAASPDPAPQSFGEASLLVDPPNDVMQYCFARVINHHGTGMAGRGLALIIPRSTIKYIENNADETASSMGTFACNIDYTFHVGSRAWGLTMVAATGQDNKSTCAPVDRCVRTVTHDTSTYRVDFELK